MTIQLTPEQAEEFVNAGLIQPEVTPHKISRKMTQEQLEQLASWGKNTRDRAVYLWPMINTHERFAEYNANAGRFFFSPGTMEFFNSKFITDAGLRYDGDSYYMVIRNIDWNADKRYSIVQMGVNGDAHNLEDYGNLYSLKPVLKHFKTIGQEV